jgi:tetratricopeptide (TPR) repeat protein
MRKNLFLSTALLIFVVGLGIAVLVGRSTDKVNVNVGSSATELYDTALELFRVGNPSQIEQATKYLQQAIEQDPAFVKSFIVLAEIYFQNDMNEKALNIITQGLSNSPDDIYLNLLKMRVLYDSKENDKLLILTKTLLDDDRYKTGQIAVINHAQGNVKFRINSFNDGLRDLLLSEKLFDSIDEIDPALYNDIGFGYQLLGKNQEAINYYKRAIQNSDDFIAAHNNLAGFYLVLGDTDNAKLYMQKSLKINPNQPALRSKLSEL